MMQGMLEQLGFVVDAVDSGVDAVVEAQNSCPDLVVMDMQLRDVPGREAVEWLRANPALRSIPIVVMTGNSRDESDLAAIRPGGWLRKPASYHAIESIVRELFG
jgi:CheY-like chemotaxis protein